MCNYSSPGSLALLIIQSVAWHDPEHLEETMINFQFTKRSYLTQTMNCLENNRAEERIIEEHIICQERQTEKMEPKKKGSHCSMYLVMCQIRKFLKPTASASQLQIQQAGDVQGISRTSIFYGIHSDILERYFRVSFYLFQQPLHLKA